MSAVCLPPGCRGLPGQHQHQHRAGRRLRRKEEGAKDRAEPAAGRGGSHTALSLSLSPCPLRPALGLAKLSVYASGRWGGSFCVLPGPGPRNPPQHTLPPRVPGSAGVQVLRGREVCSHARLPPGAQGRAEDRGGPSFRAGMELGLLEGQVLCWMRSEGPGTRDGEGVGGGVGPALGQTGRRRGCRKDFHLLPRSEGLSLGFLCWVWSALCWSCDSRPSLSKAAGSTACLFTSQTQDKDIRWRPGSGRLQLMRGQWQRAPCAPLEALGVSPYSGQKPPTLRGRAAAVLGWEELPGPPSLPTGAAGFLGGRELPSLQAGEATWWEEHPRGLWRPGRRDVSRPRFQRGLWNVSAPQCTHESSQGSWRRCGYHSGSHRLCDDVGPVGQQSLSATCAGRGGR